jgi:hypothetical protein
LTRCVGVVARCVPPSGGLSNVDLGEKARVRDEPCGSAETVAEGRGAAPEAAAARMTRADVARGRATAAGVDNVAVAIRFKACVVRGA